MDVDFIVSTFEQMGVRLNSVCRLRKYGYVCVCVCVHVRGEGGRCMVVCVLFCWHDS